MIGFEMKETQAALNRLKGITGFVTTLCHIDDCRPVVFNRYDHVVRVLGVNRILCKELGVDSRQSDEIIILHDLNRWPFAQNSEKGYFDQEKNVESYLRNLDSSISQDIVDDIVTLHKKQLFSMRKDSRYAHISDIIAGLIEDPILLIAGLNVHPENISKDFADLLGLDFSNEGIEILEKLCKILNIDKDINGFNQLFQDLFEKHSIIFIQKFLEKYDTTEEIINAIQNTGNYLKENLFRPIIYPINNECICHSSWIKEKIINRIIQDMGVVEATDFLLSLDEYELFKYLLNKDFFKEEEMSKIYPDLDYTSGQKSQIKKFVTLR